MNKKGFTLVELLATIVIIGLIMGIVLPSATRVSTENKDELYKTYEEMIEEYASVSYYRDRYYIELSDLEELGKVKNECEGYVLVDHTNSVLGYSAYINCGDKYKTPGFDDAYYKNVLSIPTCKAGLIYNGTNQQLVESSVGYNLTNNLRKDVGRQNVLVSISDKTRYSWQDKSQADKVVRNCEIGKRAITLRADDKVRTYGDTYAYVFTNTITNGIAGENPLSMQPSYTVKNSGGSIIDCHYKTPAGTYTIIPSTAVTSNYTLRVENGTLTINKKKLTPVINNCSDKTYDGNNVASCTLKPIQGVVSGDNVSVTISGCTFDNPNAGTNKTITCNIVLGGSSSSNYELTTYVLTSSAKVNQKSIPINWGSTTTFTYNNTYQAPTASATSGVPNETINITRTTQIDAGSYTSTATCSSVTGGQALCSNYTFTGTTKDFTINKKSVAINWGSTTTFTYNNTYQAPTASATSGVSGETINITRTTQIDAGSYTSTASCSSVSGGRAKCSNYTFTGTTKDFTINKKSVAINWGSTTTFTYNNTYQAPTAGATSGVSGETINITRTTQIDAGSYTSTASCSSVTGGQAKCSNYTFTGTTKNFTINKKSIAIEWGGTTFTYNGGSQAPTAGATSGVSGETINIKRTTQIDAGSYTSTASCSSVTGGQAKCTNYTFTGTTKDFTINKKSIAIAWGSTTTFTYNGGNQAPTASATSGVSGETINITRTTQIDVGSYTSTASCSSVTGGQAKCTNYTFTGTTKDFTINKKSIAIAWGSTTTFTYNGGNQAPTASATGVSGETINITRTTQIDVGSYTSTASCSSVTGGRAKCGNYTFTSTTKGFTITAKSIAISWGSTTTFTYNGSGQAPTASATGVSGETINITRTTQIDAGTYTSTASCSSVTGGQAKCSNYTFTSTTKGFTINAKSIAISWGSKTTFTYNGSGQAPTASASSGVSGETINITRTTQIDAGTYTSTASCSSVTGGRAKCSNYTFTGTTKGYTINPQKCNKPTSISISSAGKVTWTSSSNCSSGTHQISINSSSWTTASSGVDYKSTIIAATGTRTVYVKVLAPNANYSNSDAESKSTTVYSVTLTKGTGISSVSGAGNYITGATVTLGASASSGYNWSKWTNTSGGSQVSTTAAYSAKISSNWAYTANATPITYKITLNNQSATSAGTTTVWYQYNTTKVVNGVTCYYYSDSSLTNCLSSGYYISKPTRNGYSFSGYYTSTGGAGTNYVNSSGAFVNNIYKTTGDKTLYAKWTPNKIKITLDKNGGSGGDTTFWFYYGTRTFYGDEGCTRTISSISRPSRNGYSFSGYQGNGSSGGSNGENYVAYGTTEFASDLATDIYKDATLYAQWTPNKIKITLDKNGGSGGDTTFWFYYGTSTFYGDEACTTKITSISRPSKTGYNFDGYYGNGSSGGTNLEKYVAYGSTEFASDLATDIYKDATLYASWSGKKIKITLDKNGGSGGDTYFWYYYGTSTFYGNEACTTAITSISKPSLTGYSFKGYQGDGTSGGDNGENYVAYGTTEFASDLATDIYKDATLKAVWEKNCTETSKSTAFRASSTTVSFSGVSSVATASASNGSVSCSVSNGTATCTISNMTGRLPTSKADCMVIGNESDENRVTYISNKCYLFAATGYRYSPSSGQHWGSACGDADDPKTTDHCKAGDWTLCRNHTPCFAMGHEKANGDGSCPSNLLYPCYTCRCYYYPNDRETNYIYESTVSICYT